eukprot:206326-Chlamydomonas_euryale.AAC.13
MSSRYVWDRQLRKYVDRELAGSGGIAVGVLTEADMVYAGDDEAIPSIAEARAAEAAAEAAAELGGRKRGRGAAAGSGAGTGDTDGGDTAGSVADAGVVDDEQAAADAAELIEAAGGPGKPNKKPRKAPNVRRAGDMAAYGRLTWEGQAHAAGHQSGAACVDVLLARGRCACVGVDDLRTLCMSFRAGGAEQVEV